MDPIRRTMLATGAAATAMAAAPRVFAQQTGQGGAAVSFNEKGAVRIHFEGPVPEDAIDLCDVFSSFSPQGKATLHEISRIMGLPGKPKRFDGREVEGYFHEGKIREIADYCDTYQCGCGTSCFAAR